MLEPFQFFLLAEAGRFDPSPVLERVRAGDFALVLSGWRLRRLPGLAEALAERYERGEEIGPYQVWRPAPQPPAPTDPPPADPAPNGTSP
jgi:hypothetical protein